MAGLSHREDDRLRGLLGRADPLISRFRSLTPRTWDWVLAGLLLLADLSEMRFLHSLLWTEREIASFPVLTGFAFVRAAALVFRRRHPVAVSLIVSATLITVPTNGLSYLFRSYWPALAPHLQGDPGWWPTAFGWTASLEVLITVYAVAALRERRVAFAVAGWHVLCITPWFLPQLITWGPGPYCLAALILGIAIHLGGVRKRMDAALTQIQTRRDHIEKERRQGVSDAARRERARISSELQRLVADHLRKMVEQAEIARIEVDSFGATVKARDAITAIERSGRAALTDARRALGLLREGSAAERSLTLSSERHTEGWERRVKKDAVLPDKGPNEENLEGSGLESPEFSLLLFVYLVSEIGASQSLPPWRALANVAHLWDVTAMVLIVGPFVLGRRAPLLTSLLVTGGFALHVSVAHFFGIAALIALLVGVYTVWATKGAPQRLVATTAAALVLPLAQEQLAAVLQFGLLTIYLPFLPAACFFGWQERRLGLALEVLRGQEEELRLITEEERERARLDERLRIARELHDVTAHSLSVMTIQAGAARTVADKAPEQARRALTTIEETGRRAHGEIEGLFSRSLESPESAGLGVEALPTLVEEVRETGLDVELHISAPREPLPRGLDISLYRVVQEALTNAVKHAGPTRVQVRVECMSSSISVAVVDEGGTTPSSETSRSFMEGRGGRGLIGIQERVKAYGGTMNAGSRGRGFSVHVTVPIKPDEIDPVASALK